MRQFGITDIGLVRESNQDTYACGISGGGVPFAFVCDGMGGPGGGEIASTVAIEILTKFFAKKQSGSDLNSVWHSMSEIIKTVNSEIIKHANRRPEFFGMGTTLVAAFLFKDKALIANIGDSRAYVASGGEIRQVTKDHSVVQELIDLGSITSVDAAMHPQKNIITRALGAYEDAEADFYVVDVDKTTQILLCSDGLSNLVDIHEIQLELDICDSPEEAGRALVDAAKDHGGTDNITVAIIYND